jgi:micrococcal nuclease
MTTARTINPPSRPLRLVWLALATLLLAADSPNPTARVIKIFDGDSFLVAQGSLKVEVRLWGIDAPEKGQPYGDQARQLLSNLAYQKNVTLIIHTQDQYNRQVAEVILPDGRNLNEEILRAGLAWWYQHYAPDQKQFQSLEAAARQQKLGLWADPKPTPPWDWRSKNETATADPSTGGFCASRSSQVYHPCSCETVTTIAPANLIRFKTEEEAQKSGRRHCKCKK